MIDHLIVIVIDRSWSKTRFEQLKKLLFFVRNTQIFKIQIWINIFWFINFFYNNISRSWFFYNSDSKFGINSVSLPVCSLLKLQKSLYFPSIWLLPFLKSLLKLFLIWIIKILILVLKFGKELIQVVVSKKRSIVKTRT